MNPLVACVPALLYATGAPERFRVEQEKTWAMLVQMQFVCTLPSSAQNVIKPCIA